MRFVYLKRIAALLNALSTGIHSPPQSGLEQKIANSKMSNGTIKSWVKGVERRQRILNQTSLMRVEFKYENKAVPTASFAGTEALRCRGGGGVAATRRGPYRAIIARDAWLANSRQPYTTKLPRPHNTAYYTLHALLYKTFDSDHSSDYTSHCLYWSDRSPWNWIN